MNHSSVIMQFARAGALAATVIFCTQTAVVAMNETSVWSPKAPAAGPAKLSLSAGLTSGTPFPAEPASSKSASSQRSKATFGPIPKPRPVHLAAHLHTAGSARSLGAALRKPHQPGGNSKQTQRTGTSFFGTAAIRFANITSAREWNRVRSVSANSLDAGLCLSDACKTRFEKIRLFPDTAEEATFVEKLQAANTLVNRAIAYQEDRVAYRRLDYWASPTETVRRGIGDCEDFAILKHDLLLKAGVPAKSLSLVVLKDTKRDLYHAVLAVSTNKGHYILDNVVDRVYMDNEINHYQPLFSFSADRSWLHGKPRGGTPQRMVSLDAVAPGTDRTHGFHFTPAALTGVMSSEVYPVVRH